MTRDLEIGTDVATTQIIRLTPIIVEASGDSYHLLQELASGKLTQPFVICPPLFIFDNASLFVS
jgi:hypothetical protein